MLQAFTGDDTGLLKRVRLSPASKAGPVRRWGTQAAGGGVSCSCWGPAATGEEFVGVGLETGAVRFWRADEDVEAPTAEFDAGLGVAISGVHVAGSSVIACDRQGMVNTWKWDNAASASDPLASFETGGNASVASFAPDGSHLAVGDKDRDLTVWDVTTGAQAFKARNVPNDNLDLSVPVWVAALCHIPSEPNHQRIAMATGYVQSRLRGEVRLYDVAAQRKPVLRSFAPLGEEALRSVACTHDGRYVIAGSTTGTICRLDLRMGLKRVSAYRGASGSIRSIACHESLPIVACCSLDRHVRVYPLEGGDGKAVQKVYLKQRLSTMLLSSEVPKGSIMAAAADEEAEEEDGEDVDAMLDGLPEVGGGEEEEEEDDDDDEENDGLDELDGGIGTIDDDDEEEEAAGGAAAEDDDDDEEEEEEGGGASSSMAAVARDEKRVKRNKVGSAKKLRRLAMKTAEAKAKGGGGSSEGKAKKKKRRREE